MANTMNVATTDVRSACASYELGSVKIQVAKNLRSDFYDCWALLQESVVEVGGICHLNWDEETKEPSITVEGLDKESEEYKAATRYAYLTETLWNRAKTYQTEGETAQNVLLDCIPAQIVAAKAIYQYTGNVNATGDFNVTCKVSKKYPDGIKSVTADFSLLDVFGKMFEKLGAKNINDHTVAKVTRQLITVTTGAFRVSSQVGVHAVKLQGVPAAKKDVANALTGYLYNGFNDYVRSEDGCIMENEHGDRVKMHYDGKWELSANFQERPFCTVTSIDGKTCGYNVTTKFFETVPADFEIVRKGTNSEDK